MYTETCLLLVQCAHLWHQHLESVCDGQVLHSALSAHNKAHSQCLSLGPCAAMTMRKNVISFFLSHQAAAQGLPSPFSLHPAFFLQIEAHHLPPSESRTCSFVWQHTSGGKAAAPGGSHTTEADASRLLSPGSGASACFSPRADRSPCRRCQGSWAPVFLSAPPERCGESRACPPASAPSCRCTPAPRTDSTSSSMPPPRLPAPHGRCARGKA